MLIVYHALPPVDSMLGRQEDPIKTAATSEQFHVKFDPVSRRATQGLRKVPPILDAADFHRWLEDHGSHCKIIKAKQTFSVWKTEKHDPRDPLPDSELPGKLSGYFMRQAQSNRLRPPPRSKLVAARECLSRPRSRLAQDLCICHDLPNNLILVKSRPGISASPMAWNKQTASRERPIL